MMKNPATRRRAVAAAAIVMQLCLGTVRPLVHLQEEPMMAANGWSETQTQFAFMVNSAHVRNGRCLLGHNGRPHNTTDIGSLGRIMFGAGVLLAGVASSIKSITLLIFAYGLGHRVRGRIRICDPHRHAHQMVPVQYAKSLLGLQ